MKAMGMLAGALFPLTGLFPVPNPRIVDLRRRHQVAIDLLGGMGRGGAVQSDPSASWPSTGSISK